MIKIYISGPISGRLYADAFAEFAKAEEYIRILGYEPMNPMRILPEGRSYREYMEKDIRLLMDCSSICLLPGYSGSKGALTELMVAQSLNMPVLSLEEVEHQYRFGGDLFPAILQKRR